MDGRIESWQIPGSTDKRKKKKRRKVSKHSKHGKEKKNSKKSSQRRKRSEKKQEEVFVHSHAKPKSHNRNITPPKRDDQEGQPHCSNSARDSKGSSSKRERKQRLTSSSSRTNSGNYSGKLKKRKMANATIKREVERLSDKSTESTNESSKKKKRNKENEKQKKWRKTAKISVRPEKAKIKKRAKKDGVGSIVEKGDKRGHRRKKSRSKNDEEDKKDTIPKAHSKMPTAMGSEISRVTSDKSRTGSGTSPGILNIPDFPERSGTPTKVQLVKAPTMQTPPRKKRKVDKSSQLRGTLSRKESQNLALQTKIKQTRQGLKTDKEEGQLMKHEMENEENLMEPADKTTNQIERIGDRKRMRTDAFVHKDDKMYDMTKILVNRRGMDNEVEESGRARKKTKLSIDLKLPGMYDTSMLIDDDRISTIPNGNSQVNKHSSEEELENNFIEPAGSKAFRKLEAHSIIGFKETEKEKNVTGGGLPSSLRTSTSGLSKTQLSNDGEEKVRFEDEIKVTTSDEVPEDKQRLEFQPEQQNGELDEQLQSLAQRKRIAAEKPARNETCEQGLEDANNTTESTTPLAESQEQKELEESQDRPYLNGLVEIRTLFEIYGMKKEKKESFEKLLDSDLLLSDKEISKNLRKAIGDLPMHEKLLEKVLKLMRNSGLLNEKEQEVLQKNLVPHAVNESVTIALIAQVLQRRRLKH